MKRHPGRFEVFGGIDPRWGKDGLALFERSIVEFGFRGLKLYPPCGYSPSDPALFPFYEICSHYGLPVLVHIGPTSPALSFDTSYPFLVDAAACRFPDVNFILAHGSVSFTEECAMLCRFRPNIYLDISAYQIVEGWDSLANAVKRTVKQGINYKILFGTDWPVYRLQGTQRTFVEAVAGENGGLWDLDDQDRWLILRGSILQLLGNFKGLDGKGREAEPSMESGRQPAMP
jgi:predicted TIM-barrel fold metal-dependent hydrolase